VEIVFDDLSGIGFDRKTGKAPGCSVKVIDHDHWLCRIVFVLAA
jgi:hypothetical protein